MKNEITKVRAKCYTGNIELYLFNEDDNEAMLSMSIMSDNCHDFSYKENFDDIINTIQERLERKLTDDEIDMIEFKINTRVDNWSKVYPKGKMIIAEGSCDGQEAKFEKWMNERYSEIETSIENSLNGGLFEDGELVENKNFWDQFCSDQ